MVSDPHTALEDVIVIGFERLLTSGLESTALEGLEMLKVLVEKVFIYIFLLFSNFSLHFCKWYIIGHTLH